MACIMEDTLKSPDTFYAKEDSELEIEIENDYGYDLDKEIERPFNHIVSVQGKLIRHEFMEAFNDWMNIPADKMAILHDITYYLHNVALMIDDIQDNSPLRRGIPAAHTIFGIGNTVNSADFILAKTFGKVLELNHPEAIKIYIDAMLKATIGQGMDIYYRDAVICPTEEEYCEMVIGKTSSLFTGILALMELFSTVKRDPKEFSNYIGVYFQIRDDFCNLTDTRYFDSKGYCEDITEGKFSFPIVHAVNTHPEEGKIIMDILRQRTYDIELKKYCVSLIEKCGSFEYTRKVLEERFARLQEDMAGFGENPRLASMLDRFYLVNV